MIPILLLIPLIVGFGTQVVKALWETRGRLTWSSLDSYGGMPSTHTAIMVSLATVIGLHENVASADFAIASVVAIIVIRDAMGFRRYLGSHGHALNLMVRELPKKEQDQFEHFRERLGHTPLEAFVGAVIGFCASSVLYVLWFDYLRSWAS